NAKILAEETKKRAVRLAEAFAEADALIVPGFIGKTLSGKITTIGRGGSDSTAFVLADALGAKEIILISDIDGIRTSDPKRIAGTQKIDKIDALKLAGMSDSGRKFIHKKALYYKPAGIDVKMISNKSASLDAQGTVITNTFPELDVEINLHKAQSLTIMGNSLPSSHEFMADLISYIAKEKVALLGMTTDSESVVLYFPAENFMPVAQSIHDIIIRHKEAIAMAVREELAIIKTNGIGLQETPGSLALISGTLSKNGINIYGFYNTMSEIFLVVEWEKREEAQRLIKGAFEAD
ncbi:hypothetical protein COV61_01170, partial [Candidatus Micrarchaeota archaeon CG11_big_fil_rev_8_21_14_0_20_47_5]